MMDDTANIMAMLIVGLALFGGLLVLAAFTTTADSEWQSQAIERGYAIYCTDTGDFAWKGECGREALE